jgi:hypothetical protein
MGLKEVERARRFCEQRLAIAQISGYAVGNPEHLPALRIAKGPEEDPISKRSYAILPHHRCVLTDSHGVGSGRTTPGQFCASKNARLQEGNRDRRLEPRFAWTCRVGNDSDEGSVGGAGRDAHDDGGPDFSRHAEIRAKPRRDAAPSFTRLALVELDEQPIGGRDEIIVVRQAMR